MPPRLRPRDRLRIWGLHIFLIALLSVSLRHCAIEGDHLWTDEGERLSWSMRLRGKVCDYALKIDDEEWAPPDLSRLSFWQRGNLEDPYFLRLFALSGPCVGNHRVYARVNCRAIGRVAAALIDPATDLCQTRYSFVEHNAWIHPYPGPLDPHYREWFESSSRVRDE